MLEAPYVGFLFRCYSNPDDGNALALWKRRGKRAFDAEAEGQDSKEQTAHD